MENYRLKEKHAIFIIKILNFIMFYIFFSIVPIMPKRLNIDRDRFYIYHIKI